MTPLRAKMIRAMELQRLAPKTQKAYIAAVAGLAKFYGRSPAQLPPDQIRAYLHHLLVERHLAWSSCNQVACGLKFSMSRPSAGMRSTSTCPPVRDAGSCHS